MAELDELAAVLCAGGEHCRENASSVYRQGCGAAAGDKPENVDDGAGGGELICAERIACAARSSADGTVVFTDLGRVFDVLGVPRKGG